MQECFAFLQKARKKEADPKKVLAALAIQTAWRGWSTRRWTETLFESKVRLAVEDRIKSNTYNYEIVWNAVQSKADDASFICGICLQGTTTLVSQCHINTKCAHRFHYNCLLRYIEWCVMNEIVPKCPYCRTSICYYSPLLRHVQRFFFIARRVIRRCCECCTFVPLVLRVVYNPALLDEFVPSTPDYAESGFE